MLFETFLMPDAPQPSAYCVNRPPAIDPTAAKLDQSAQPADQQESFLATLNSVSGCRSCSSNRSDAVESQTALSVKPNQITANADDTNSTIAQDAVQHGAVEFAVTESVPETPLLCERPVTYLFQMVLSTAGAWLDQGPTLPFKPLSSDGLPALTGQIQFEGQMRYSGLLQIGPFEQLQSDISPEASNISFLKQLLNRTVGHQFAAESSDFQADNSIFASWPSQTAVAIEADIADGQMGRVANWIDRLNSFLIQRTDYSFLSSDATASTVDVDGKQTIVNGDAVTIKEELFWQKIIGTARPTDDAATQPTQLTGVENNGRLSAGPAKLIQAEPLVQPHLPKDGQQTENARNPSQAKIVEPAISPNGAAGNSVAKLMQENVSFKPSGLQNDLPAIDQTSSKVIQVDGEAKDSGFLASQESLPNHTTRFESGGHSAEGAQRSLAAQTMNQIVQKAVLLNNNGQNTVQIDLKPDFLGPIRMQIVTESHQVAVRIMAEIPFVRDMLESNLNQLKTELQAQGLQVDELEVSVAHDSRADDDLYQKAAEARRVRAAKSNRHSVDAPAEEQGSTRPVHGHDLVESAIDFFA